LDGSVPVESGELLLPLGSVPEPLLDLRPLAAFLLDDFLSEDRLPAGAVSDEVVVALAAADGWRAAPGAATATPPPIDRPTTISSAPVPASA